MEDELLAKMYDRLKAGIDREEELLFFLVKIRKFLERADLKREHPTLLFYCDWSLHAAMDRQVAAQVVRAIDQLVDRHCQGDQRALGEVAALLSLTELRRELLRFCDRAGLPSSIFTDEASWTEFRDLFVRNVSDCPLVLRGPTRHIRSLSFVGPGLAPFGDQGFPVRLELVSGGSVELRIS